MMTEGEGGAVVADATVGADQEVERKDDEVETDRVRATVPATEAGEAAADASAARVKIEVEVETERAEEVVTVEGQVRPSLEAIPPDADEVAVVMRMCTETSDDLTSRTQARPAETIGGGPEDGDVGTRIGGTALAGRTRDTRNLTPTKEGPATTRSSMETSAMHSRCYCLALRPGLRCLAAGVLSE